MYARATWIETRRRTGPLPLPDTSWLQIGYTTLRRTTPPTSHGQYARRLLFLKPYDRAAPEWQPNGIYGLHDDNWPAEAVDPELIAAGIWGSRITIHHS